MVRILIFFLLVTSCQKQNNSLKKAKKIDAINVAIKLIEVDNIDNNLLELTFFNHSDSLFNITKTPEFFVKVEVFKNNSWQELEWLESEEAINNGRIMPFYMNDTIVTNKDQIFYKTDLTPHKVIKVGFSFNVIYLLRNKLQNKKVRIYFEYILPDGDRAIISDYLYL